MNLSKRTNLLVKGAILLSLAFILSFFEFPIIPSVPWLKLDFSAVPLMLSTLMFGPIFGLVLTLLLQVLDITVKVSTTGGVGQLANFLLIGSFITATGIFAGKRTGLKKLIVSMLLGTLVLIVMAMITNHFILVPLFSPTLVQKKAIYTQYLFKWIPLFNFIKGISISAITAVLYFKLSSMVIKEQDIANKIKTKESEIINHQTT